jgi:acetylornithine deacetylase/succinyl-diaminopimelate desuccinylase-like protein
MLDDVLNFVDANLQASLDRLFELLRIDSISTDPAYKDSCRRAATWLVGELEGLGFAASARDTPGHPVVVGHHGGQGPHILFYAHYDVQPVDPVALWEVPPFDPRIVTLPDGRRAIAARGASDDKGQLMTFLEAVRAWHAVTGKVPAKVTMLLEGEEESGSINLKPFLQANVAELKADVAFICDTGMWSPTRPAITTSLRGLGAEEITITAAKRDLHSGMYGSAARNPNHVLAAILAALHDDDGRVTVAGFYDGVSELQPAQKKQWDSLGFNEREFLADVGLSIPAGEKGRTVLEQIWSRPTLEINGMVGGYTAPGFKTVIPSQASAKVSFRLVGKQDPAKISAAFRKFVSDRVPGDCKVEFRTHGGSPARTLPLDGPFVKSAASALADEWGEEPALMGAGGSIPVAGDFKDVLGLDSVMVGFALDDDRIHSPNEKYDLASYHRGIRSWVRILAALAG